MADGPWRCSACGTINEPVANSCRTCGRWPSLFDLQDSIVEDVELEDAREAAPAAGVPLEPEPLEPEPLEPEPLEPEPLEPELLVPELLAPEPLEAERFEPEAVEPEPATERPARRRRMFDPPPTDPVFEEGEGGRRARWISWLVPLAFVVYIVISALTGR